MHLRLILQVLALLVLANATPVLVNDVLGRRWSWPIDGGVRLVDGQPLLGSSKTIRGVLFSLLLTAVGAPLVGLGWKVGLLTGAFAMVGDLFSSFLKRRTRLPAGGRASGLDQMPESLFPLLACRHALGLSGRDIAVAVMAFFLGEVVLSLLFYKLRLRDRPY